MSGKILLIDDDREFVANTRAILERRGYEVAVAYEGTECIEKVRSVEPDIVVLDVMMPECNGYDACAELKSNESTKNVPVILLTGVASCLGSTTYTRQQGMETEANEYLSKPVEPEKLSETIEEVLSRARFRQKV